MGPIFNLLIEFFLVTFGFLGPSPPDCPDEPRYPFESLLPCDEVISRYPVEDYLRIHFTRRLAFGTAYDHAIVGRLTKKKKRSWLRPYFKIEVIEVTAYYNQCDFRRRKNPVTVIYEHGDPCGLNLAFRRRYISSGGPRAITTIHFPEKPDKSATERAYIDFHDDKNPPQFFELVLLVKQAQRVLDESLREKLTPSNSAWFADMVMRLVALIKDNREIYECHTSLLSLVGLDHQEWVGKEVNADGIEYDFRAEFLKDCEWLRQQAIRWGTRIT